MNASTGHRLAPCETVRSHYSRLRALRRDPFGASLVGSHCKFGHRSRCSADSHDVACQHSQLEVLVDPTASGEEASFENRYSPRAKKCYILRRYALPRREPPLLVLHLFDINGGGELGRFSRTGAGAPSQCEVMETACKSEEEWRDLARLLLEQ